MKKGGFSLIVIIILGLITLSGCKESESAFYDSSVYALYNCTIIDGTGGLPIEKGAILVKDNKILKVGIAQDMDIPKAVKKIDLGGKTVLPGFINAHVHDAYNETNLKNWLNGGVTTVRDLGARVTTDQFSFIKERDRYNKDPNLASIVSATPIITKPNGYGRVYVDSTQEAKDKILEYVNQDIDLIKISIEDASQGQIFPVLTPDEIKTIVDTAHSNNRKVSAHITHSRHLQLAIDSDIDDIAHMVMEPLDEAIIQEIVDKGIYWVPTLELWRGVSKVNHINIDIRTIQNLSRFYHAGGKIALGTDYDGYRCEFDKGFPITEVQLMKKAGMSNMDIIVAGTKNAAYVCDIEDKLGTLEEGKIADIVVVNGNPLEDLEALEKPYMVIHHGEVVVE